MRKFLYLALILLLIAFSDFDSSMQNFYSLRRTKLEFLLNNIASQIINLKATLNEVNMRYYLGEDVRDEKVRVNEEIRKFFLNEDYYEFISEGVEKARNEFEKRRFCFLRLYFDFMKISFSPEIEKLQDEIMDMRKKFLTEYKKEKFPDPEECSIQDYERMERLWKNFGKQVEPLMRKLVKLRNKKAGELGYQGWLDLKFKLSEIDRDKFERLLNKLKSEIPDLFLPIIERAKREIGWDKIYEVYLLPEFKLIKSYTDRIVEKGLVISTFETLDSIGINISQDKESPIEIIYSEDFPFSAYDFLMRPGKNGKSIIIFNLKWGGYTPDVRLHEIGHAVYDYFIDENSPLELQRWEGIYSAYSEAMAEVLSFFIIDEDWLRKFFIIKDKVDGKEIVRSLNGEEITQFSKAMKVKLMVNLLSWMGNYEFEREIYNNPDQDYEELFTRIKKEFKRDDFPIRFSWSSMLSFFASSDESIYYQNYILSYIIAAQVHNRLREKFGKIFGSKEIGEFLINKLYKFGMSHPWEEVIEEATGKELSAEDLINLISFSSKQD